MKSIIPNFLTSLNLFCGCIAVLSFLNHCYFTGILLVLLSATADFFDGFVARLMNVQSELGKELDSLADMISFGFVPGTLLYVAFLNNSSFSSFAELLENQYYLPFIGFIITVFSGVRLAKFNIDKRQSQSFIGLPTPANTLFFLTIPLTWVYEKENEFVNEMINNNYILTLLTLLFSFLLIAELPLIALKFNGFNLKNNRYRYLLISSGIVFVLLFGHLSIPLILVSYICISCLEHFLTKAKT